MGNKLFKRATIKADDPVGAMTAELEPHFLTFTLRWTPGRPVLLYALWARGSGEEQWQNLLAHVIGDNDGEITVDMGWYPRGEVMVHVGVFALEDVERAATFIIEGGRVTPLLPAPDAEEKYVAIKRKETWEDDATYIAGEEA